MRSDYTDVFRGAEAVEKYDRREYAPRSYSSQISARQREWLRAFVATALPAPPVHHDFACGTGRGLRMLAGMTAASHGYDTSPAMLARAAELGAPGELHLVEEEGPLPGPADVAAPADAPTVVTVFRLLLNAPEPVRDRAMEFAAGMLPRTEAGLLVVENHGNASSIRHLRGLVRRGGDGRWFAELSHEEVEALLDRYGFDVVARQGFSMLTRGCYAPALGQLVPGVDSWASRRNALSAWATDVVYVARRR